MPEWTHVWRGRRNLPHWYGRLCRILVARRGRFLLEFHDWDHTRVVTVRGTFRRRPVEKPLPHAGYDYTDHDCQGIGLT